MSKLGNISSSNLIDAKLEEHQMCGSKHCPGCGHKLEAKPDWVGLPAGVKFDPTDQELIEHLEAKVESKNIRSHPLIDEFIPTIQGEDGICYTHPEKLPGVTRDGLSRHFFHRPSKAYTTGTRKRRKIQTELSSDNNNIQGSTTTSSSTGETRWHKTGKTRAVMVNGKQKGCKKILVLYTNFGKNRKPEKTNWVMHQYHLGELEEEKEGELVVSKIFYQTQPRQCGWSDRSTIIGEGRSDNVISVKEINDLSVAPSNISSNYISTSTMDIQQLKSDQLLSFVPFRRNFDHEVEIEEASAARDQGQPSGTCEEIPDHQRPNRVAAGEHYREPLHHHRVQHDQLVTSAFHVNRPSHSISAIIAPPPLHHSSIILGHEDSYHVSQIMLQSENNFQQEQQQQQHHHKELGGRSASGSGLEELIMGCTSTNIKEESPITNPQEAEWMKYSSFWPDPDNPNHHG